MICSNPIAQRSKVISVRRPQCRLRRVGYLTDVAGFPKFDVDDSNGNPIAGNSNAAMSWGDEYGTSRAPTSADSSIGYLEMASKPVTSDSLTGQRLEQRADRRPELLLDLNGDGVLEPVGSRPRASPRRGRRS